MKKENMLVVEDEDIMREALSDYFSDVGHKVDTANDGVGFRREDVGRAGLSGGHRQGVSILQFR